MLQAISQQVIIRGSDEVYLCFGIGVDLSSLSSVLASMLASAIVLKKIHPY